MTPEVNPFPTMAGMGLPDIVGRVDEADPPCMKTVDRLVEAFNDSVAPRRTQADHQGITATVSTE